MARSYARQCNGTYVRDKFHELLRVYRTFLEAAKHQTGNSGIDQPYADTVIKAINEVDELVKAYDEVTR